MSSLQVEWKGDCVTNVGLTLVSMTPEIVSVAYSPPAYQTTGHKLCWLQVHKESK